MAELGALPTTLPVFPLVGVLLLPGTELKLNIFEPRYLAMVDDAMRDHRLIGMIQPRDNDGPQLYTIGCAGRIFEYAETEDGRYLITLKGVQRFQVQREVPCMRGYRLVQPDWEPFAQDRTAPELTERELERERLIALLKAYFNRLDVQANWQLIEEAPAAGLVNNLSMACPFPPGEKQALLEAPALADRAQVLRTILAMASVGAVGDAEGTAQ